MCLCTYVNSHHKFTSPKVPKLLLLNYYQSCESCKRMWMSGNLMKIIAIYLCIHGKCNPWDYVTMTRDVRLFKV